MGGRETIGPSGLAFLLVGFLFGSTLLLPLGAQAKQAAWLATLTGGLAGVGVTYIHARLATRFPGQCLITYSRQILGRFAGSVVGLLYIWYGFHLGALVLRNFGEFLVAALLPQTPLSVLILMLMLVCAFSVKAGLEPLARASQVLVLTVLVSLTMAVALLVKEARLEDLQPWLSDQPVSILQAGLMILSFPFGEAVLFAQLYPQVRPVRAITRTTARTLLVGTLILTGLSALNTAVLGQHIRTTSRFSSLVAVRQIILADFITNLDVLVVGAWVFTGFIKASVCLYFVTTGLTTWLHLKEYRPLVLPVAVAMACLSVLAYTDVNEMTTFLNVWAVYSMPFQVLMPLALLITAHLRGLGLADSNLAQGG